MQAKGFARLTHPIGSLPFGPSRQSLIPSLYLRYLRYLHYLYYLHLFPSHWVPWERGLHLASRAGKYLLVVDSVIWTQDLDHIILRLRQSSVVTKNRTKELPQSGTHSPKAVIADSNLSRT